MNKSAREMFEDLGYILFINDDDTIGYRNKNDYWDSKVYFHIGKLFPMTYDYDLFEWIDDKSDGWIPMREREDDLKHTAKYGHWQKADYPINMLLHKAINQQCKELGWLDE